MKVSLIVAMDENRVIGNKNDIPWRLSADWQHVKEVTTGHPIVMGRKNFESIGRVLPNRRNIVLTRDKAFSYPGVEVAHSIIDVWKLCEDEKEIFIFGGEQIYRMFMPFIQKMHITKIHHSFEGDTYFPIVDSSEWVELSSRKGEINEKNVYEHDFHVYEKQTEWKYPVFPMHFDEVWYLAAITDVFGKVFLLKEHEELALPETFNTEKEALDFIEKKGLAK